MFLSFAAATENNRRLDSQVDQVVNRARDILRSNSSTFTRNVSTSFRSAATSHVAYPKRPRLAGASRYTNVISKEVCKTVVLLDSVVSMKEYPLTNDTIICYAEVDFLSTDDEQLVHSKIVAVVKTQLLEIGPNDIEFVKVLHKRVTTTLVADGFKWDWRKIKNLCGQGKLCVRLVNKYPEEDAGDECGRESGSLLAGSGSTSEEVGSITALSAERGSMSALSAERGSMSALSAERGSMSALSAERGSMLALSAERGSMSVLSAERGSRSALLAERGSMSALSAERGSMSALSAERGSMLALSAERGSMSAPSAERGSMSVLSAERPSRSAPSAERGSMSALSAERGSIAVLAAERGSMPIMGGASDDEVFTCNLSCK